MRNTNTHAKMKAIFKHENVYVYVNTEDELRENVDAQDTLIVEDGKIKSLYGGRVKINFRGWMAYLTIDGITIYEISFTDDDYPQKDDRVCVQQVVAYLNQIENLGVDAFLENYKNSLVQMKQDVENILKAQAYSGNERLIAKCQRLLIFLITLICSLSINMNAGLTNQHYINAYETIVNTYF